MGPVEPKPGPILAMHAATEPIADFKSNPINDKMNEPIPNIAR